MCSCRGPSACKQGRRIYNTLLLQAMALYIHGPLRCKDLLGRIPNPHSRPLWQRRSTHPARTLMHAANAPRRGDHAQISSTTHRSSTGRRTPSGIPGHTQHIPIRPRSDTQPPMLEAVQHPQPRTIRPTDNSPARNTRPSHSISHPTWKPCAGALTRCSRARPSPRRWKNSPRWKMIDPHTVRKPARLSSRTGFFFYPRRINPAECPPKPDAHLLPLRAKRGQALWTRPPGQYPPDQTVRGLHPRPAVQHADSPQGIPQPFA